MGHGRWLARREGKSEKQHLQRFRGQMEPDGFRARGRTGCGREDEETGVND